MKYIKQLSLTLALLITAVGGAWAEDTYTVTFKANGNTKTVENVTLPHTFELDPIITELYPSLSGGHGSPAGTSASGNTNVTAYNNDSKHYASISAPFEGAVTVTGQFFKDFTNHQYTLEINCMEKLVAISDDKTEATMKMPQYDVTATYTLKRDLSVETQVTVGDDHDAQPRYRVQNQGNSFVPVGLTNEQVMALFKVHDDIESKDLTAITDYTVQIFAADDNDQPTGTAMTFSNFTYAPGKYVVKAVAAEGSNYSGETALSNVFTLFQGYEVTVPAKEFITYYKDEPLYVEDEAALLYTITSVTDTEAVLSEKSDAMPSNTPMLVYNKSDETKTILLIPCAEPDMTITVAPEFKGTLTGTTIAASTENQTNYAFNGKQFVWVKDALEVGPNKAWLEIPIGMMAGAREINLVFGEATKITTTNITNITNGDWYDLNGR